jgi:hypothetical protein
VGAVSRRELLIFLVSKIKSSRRDAAPARLALALGVEAFSTLEALSRLPALCCRHG